MVGHAAVEGRQADDASQAEAVARAVDADAMAVELMAQELGDPGRCVGRLEREDAPAVMIEREADIAPETFLKMLTPREGSADYAVSLSSDAISSNVSSKS